MHYGNTQPNPLESKVWLSMNGELKTYNKHTKQWGPSTNGQPDTPTEPEVPVNPWDNIEDGVYAVSADYKPIDYNTADDTAIGVAVVAGEHKFMIAKNDATDGTNNNLYWGKNLIGKDVAGITNTSGNDGVVGEGNFYAPDFTTWTEGGLSDFAGKANTAAIINAYTEHNVTIDPSDMCSVLNTFNAASDGSNAGKSDWYVPACGQLGIIYLFKSDINAALKKIGGAIFAYDVSYYWSSSEYSSNHGWYFSLAYGYVYSGRNHGNYKDGKWFRVRFVRDI